MTTQNKDYISQHPLQLSVVTWLHSDQWTIRASVDSYAASRNLFLKDSCASGPSPSFPSSCCLEPGCDGQSSILKHEKRSEPMQGRSRELEPTLRSGKSWSHQPLICCMTENFTSSSLAAKFNPTWWCEPVILRKFCGYFFNMGIFNALKILFNLKKKKEPTATEGCSGREATKWPTSPTLVLPNPFLTFSRCQGMW